MRIPGPPSPKAQRKAPILHHPGLPLLLSGLQKKVLIVLAVIGVIGGSIFGIIIYQENKAQNERILRHQRREKRLKEWGYSSTEFDMIMENHLRSKAGITKPGFWERVKAHFKRH